MKEVVCLGIGQAGIAIADTCWDAFRLQHNLTRDGQLIHANLSDDEHAIINFFTETASGMYKPRALFIDTDRDAVDGITSSALRQFYDPCSMVWTNDQHSQPLEKLRHFTDECHHLQGFMIFNSIVGRSGSRITSRLLEMLDDQFPTKQKVGITLFPSYSNYQQLTPEAGYNSVVALPAIVDHLDLSFVLQNSALESIASRTLQCDHLRHQHLNSIVAQAVSAMTVNIRHDGCLHNQLEEMVRDLIPLNGLPFATLSYSSFVGANEKVIPELMELAQTAFEQKNCLAEYSPTRGLFTNCSMFFRGEPMIPSYVNRCIIKARAANKVRYTPWAVTGMRCGINYRPPLWRQASGLARFRESVTILSNTSAVGEVFSRLNRELNSHSVLRGKVQIAAGFDESSQVFEQARQRLNETEQAYERIRHRYQQELERKTD